MPAIAESKPPPIHAQRGNCRCIYRFCAWIFIAMDKAAVSSE